MNKGNKEALVGKNFQAIIIGSGISSLMAAALLNKKGLSVLVLEQHIKLGGYLHTFHRVFQGRKFEFETGAHYVGALKEGQAFWSLLNYLDLFESSLFNPMNEKGFDRFSFPSFNVEFASSYEKTIENFQDVFSESLEKKAISEFFQRVKEAASSFPTYEMSSDYNSQLMKETLNKSLLSVVEALTPNKKLQSAFCAHCGLHGVSPERVSFGLHALLLDSLLKSSFLFSKGGQAFADFIVNKLKERGVVFKTSHQVLQLLADEKNKSIKQVICKNGEIFEADWVLSGMHPKNLFPMIKGLNFRPAFKNRLSLMEESIGISSLYLVVHFSKTRKYFEKNKNYFILQSEAPSSLLELGSLSHPTSLFLSAPHRDEKNDFSVFSAHVFSPISWFAEKQERQEEGGREKCTWVKKENYLKLKEDLMQGMLLKLQECFPGITDEIVYKELSTPMTNLRYNGSVDGSAYGVMHSFENTGARALGPRTHVSNLILTGQSTLLPGILGASISGLRSAGNIVGIKSVLREMETQRGEVR